VFPIERQQPVIGDRNPMRVSAEISQNLQRAAEGWFGVNNPVLPMQSPEQSMELFRVSEWRCRPGASQLLAAVETFQTGTELTAKHPAEDFHRQEERIPGMHPTAVVRR
jgi:hypothetical protein